MLGFLRDQIRERGFPPTMKEITRHFGWGKSNTAARGHLRALQRKGYLTLAPNRSRGITLKLGLVWLETAGFRATE